jgi:hypothetical protein
MRIGFILLFVPLLVALPATALPLIPDLSNLSLGLPSSERSSTTRSFLKRSQALLLKRKTPTGDPEDGATPRKPHKERQTFLEGVIAENAFKPAGALTATDHASAILYYMNRMLKPGVEPAVLSHGVLKSLLRGGVSSKVKAEVVRLAVDEGLGHKALNAQSIKKFFKTQKF